MEASLRWGGFAKLVIAKGPQRKKRLPYKKQNETTTTIKKTKMVLTFYRK